MSFIDLVSRRSPRSYLKIGVGNFANGWRKGSVPITTSSNDTSTLYFMIRFLDFKA